MNNKRVPDSGADDRMKPITKLLRLAPVIPVLTIESLDHALPLARALVAGGLHVLEVTLRTAPALEAIAAMRREVAGASVGAGTLTRSGDFRRAADAGAQFAVTPGLTAELASAARAVNLPLLPGVATASEIIAARALGYDALKFFPAEPSGGAAALAAFAPVFADVIFCPTGGITRDNAPRYLSLPNVACVGSSWVAPADLIRAGDWTRIEALARDAASLARP